MQIQMKRNYFLPIFIFIFQSSKPLRMLAVLQTKLKWLASQPTYRAALIAGQGSLCTRANYHRPVGGDGVVAGAGCCHVVGSTADFTTDKPRQPGWSRRWKPAARENTCNNNGNSAGLVNRPSGSACSKRQMDSSFWLQAFVLPACAPASGSSLPSTHLSEVVLFNLERFEGEREQQGSPPSAGGRGGGHPSGASWWASWKLLHLWPCPPGMFVCY